MKATPPLRMYRRIASVFVLLTIVLVFVIFYYSLTYAYVTVTPSVEQADLEFTALVTEDEAIVDRNKGVFPGLLIEQEMEASGTFEATGVKTATSDVTGEVLIINEYSRTQPLIETTRLLTDDDVLFRIDENISVAPGEEVQVGMYQDDPSINVAIEPGDRLTIPGLFIDLQDFIYAEVVEVSGGDEEEISFVSKEDLDRATAELVAQLESEIANNLDPDQIAVLDAEILSKDFSHLAGEEGENFTASIRARLSGAIFQKSNVEAYATRLLESSIGNDEKLYGIESEGLVFSVDAIDQDNQLAQISGVISSGVIVRQNSTVLDKDKLIKLSADEAKAYLENTDEIESAEVEFFPFWVNSIPTFKDHIIITIEE